MASLLQYQHIVESEHAQSILNTLMV